MNYNKTFKSLAGQLLVAMPQMNDPRFSHSVIYVCGHDEQSAMGIVINKTIDSFYFKDLAEQLNIKMDGMLPQIPIHFGGPVDMARGFVIHSTDYDHSSSILLSDYLALTASLDVLECIAKDEGPSHKIIALGYAGWSALQLDREIQENSWLVVEPDPTLIYETNADDLWHKALKKLGVDPQFLSTVAGHA